MYVYVTVCKSALHEVKQLKFVNFDLEFIAGFNLVFVIAGYAQNYFYCNFSSFLLMQFVFV